MDIWRMLDIEPTTDIARIKSAYARQAKLYHPEEHPEEFKALQSAYKTALRMAKSLNAETKEVFHEVPIEVPPQDVGRYEDIVSKETEEASADTVEQETKQEEAEHDFDFSDVDAYGDRERFFKEFLLIAKNPCLINNLDVWEYFLTQSVYTELFANTNFRKDFVRTMCHQAGWRRKTILYFKRYLSGFHAKENRPAGGKWETKLLCFRIRQLPLPGIPAFCTDRFLGKKGRAFHKMLRKKISSSLEREIDLDVKADLISYLKLYLFWGKSIENYIKILNTNWVIRKTLMNITALIVCIIAVLVPVHSLEQRKENERQISYLMELYGLEPDTCSSEERTKLLEEYRLHWRYAEKAIDEVLERYERW